MNGNHIVELLKIINCSFNYDAGYKLFEVETWSCKEEYDRIFNTLRKNLFEGLCLLDNENTERIFVWAQQKFFKGK